MLATAGSRDEVLEVLQRDVYAREGVWDLEKVEIIPVSQPAFVESVAERGEGRGRGRMSWGEGGQERWGKASGEGDGGGDGLIGWHGSSKARCGRS